MRFDNEATFWYDGKKNVLDEYSVKPKKVTYPCFLMAMDDKFTTRANGIDTALNIRIRTMYPVLQPNLVTFNGVDYSVIRNPHHKMTQTFYLVERVSGTS